MLRGQISPNMALNLTLSQVTYAKHQPANKQDYFWQKYKISVFSPTYTVHIDAYLIESRDIWNKLVILTHWKQKEIFCVKFIQSRAL